MLDANDIGQALGSRGFDQLRCHPGLTQHVGVVELQPLQIELHGAPGVRGDEFGEILPELILGELIDAMLIALTDSTDRARIRIDCLGLYALELKVLEVALIVLFEVLLGWGQWAHLEVTSRLLINAPEL